MTEKLLTLLTDPQVKPYSSMLGTHRIDCSADTSDYCQMICTCTKKVVLQDRSRTLTLQTQHAFCKMRKK